MKRKIVKYSLSGLILILGLISWFSVDRAINVPESSDWVFPIFSFFLFYVFLLLGVVLIKEKLLFYSVLMISFFISLYFTFSFWHFLIIFLFSPLIILGRNRVHKDIDENIKLNIIKSFRVGKIFFLLFIAIAISSQHYFEIKNTEKENNIPEFNFDFITSKIIPIIYPDLKYAKEEYLTVDDFILTISEENSDSILRGILENQSEEEKININKNQIEKMVSKNQENILEEGRKNISKISGKNISGKENISDVFSDMINNKINEYLSYNFGKNNLPVRIWVIPALLFLTIFSLGSILNYFAVYFSAVLFWIMRKINLIEISKVSTEMEIIN